MRKLGFVAVLLTASAIASAQSPAPPPVLSTPSARNNLGTPLVPRQFGSSGVANTRYYADVYQRVLDYSRCAVHVAPQRARSFLDSAPHTLDERVKAGTLSVASRACLPYGFRAPTLFFRAGIAETLYKRRESDTAGDPATLAQLIANEQMRDRSRLEYDRRFAHAALCVSKRAPNAVDAVLQSRPGSTEEQAALMSAAQQSGGCLPTTMQFPGDGVPIYLRAYLAESALRVAGS